MGNHSFRYQGKADEKYNGKPKWPPLILHMLDLPGSAEAILVREPESTRNRMAAILGMVGKNPKRGSCSWWPVTN